VNYLNRYDDIVGKMTKFLQGLGYNPKEDVFAVPIAGLTGANIKEKLADGVCPWYKYACFVNTF
jgi:peptide chain release factor subunit 3